MLTAPRRWAHALSLIIALGAAVAQAGPGAGAVGTVAADFTLPVFGGGTMSLHEHAGKVVMLFIIGYG
jgi:hypothetical protein